MFKVITSYRMMEPEFETKNEALTWIHERDYSEDDTRAVINLTTKECYFVDIYVKVTIVE